MRDLRLRREAGGAVGSLADGRLARAVMRQLPKRLAIVVSHPIQYFAPLHQRLAQRDDLAIKVFFTWHAGQEPVDDPGFNEAFTWDIPVIDGYDFELVPNVAGDPGTHRFLGLRNPQLLARLMAWRPDLVLVHGWAWLSHLQVLHALRRRGIPTLFRGDSHLLDPQPTGPRWWLKRGLLRRVFSWPAGFLFVGEANRAYFERFGVEAARLFPCPHSIDVGRFAEPTAALEREAQEWRRSLGIAADQTVLLYAGKFERNKRPTDLMRVVQSLGHRATILVLVGGGELQSEIDALATDHPDRFRVLPFQNQSRMPVVYRLGDLFVLPSFRETWGIAVNEALACGRPVLVSDRIGCAPEIVDHGCARVFPSNDANAWKRALDELIANADILPRMRVSAAKRARAFDLPVTEAALVAAVDAVCAP